MKQNFILFLSLFSLFSIAAQSIDFKTNEFNLSISKNGQITNLSNPANGKNYLATSEVASLVRIRVAKQWEDAQQASFNEKTGIVTLHYPVSKISADIKVVQNKNHLSFELLKLSAKEKVEAITWGPIPTTISQTIGEIVGVVRDKDYAIGIQSLNTKTIGGVLKIEGGTDDGERGSVATAQPYGSSLQAYSLDRSKNRKLTVWDNYPNMTVNAIPNETTIGSKIAIFGCNPSQVLSRIGEIELAEGLPHPLIDGVWHKQSPETGRAYLITDFNEKNVDALLDYTQQAGLSALYHEGPFQSWGHFILDPERFPNGNLGMKKSVEKASKKGLRIGVHTLTSFINTNDPYVTPVPDKRLAATGTSTLIENASASASEITIASDEFFKNLKPSTLHAVQIGSEIIRFREVSATKPYKLLDCQRAAYGTKAVGHNKGETVRMLLDYPYNTLFPDFNLQQEIAGNLANFFNETGVSQMDFDGHEGCYSSGEGDYAMQTFAEKVFKETKHTLVNGSSRSSHYYWHIGHYLNWGEPWYGGFRESQGDYRLNNQPLLERNYMPNMLGWFLLSSTTTPEDIEWMMARAAGYNAGFALVARYESLQKNTNTPELLQLVKIWQEASKNKIFSANQLERLKKPENDFHLEKNSQNWKLYPFKKHQFEHKKITLQPGQPTFSEWKFTNEDQEQPFYFVLTFMGKEGSINNPWIELDGYYKLELPGEFQAGSSVVCDGKTIKLYDSKGSFKKELATKQSIPVLKTGKHSVKFDCQFPSDSELSNRFVIKTMGSYELISK
jgi:hypothetical protein